LTRRDFYSPPYSGGNTYNALVAYLRASNVVPFLTQEIDDPTDPAKKRKMPKNEFFIHLPISGGGELKTTMICFDSVAKFFPDARLVAWLNPFLGSMVLDGGMDCYAEFEKTAVFKDNAAHLAGIVKMPEWSALMKHDVAAMFKSNRTFEQCLGDKNLNIMERQRLVMAKRTLWDLLDNLEEISL
jgi:hypothetical protein